MTILPLFAPLFAAFFTGVNPLGDDVVNDLFPTTIDAHPLSEFTSTSFFLFLGNRRSKFLKQATAINDLSRAFLADRGATFVCY